MYKRERVKKIALLALMFSLVLAFPIDAHAGYLDPGSGSTLVQTIIALIASIKRFIGKFFCGKAQ